MSIRAGSLVAATLFCGGVAAVGTVATAQELDPRTYAPTPIGTTIVFASGGWSQGAFVVDASMGVDDIVAEPLVRDRAAYVFDLAGRPARALGVLPPTPGARCSGTG